jgi:hypothetical protein
LPGNAFFAGGSQLVSQSNVLTPQVIQFTTQGAGFVSQSDTLILRRTHVSLSSKHFRTKLCIFRPQLLDLGLGLAQRTLAFLYTLLRCKLLTFDCLKLLQQCVVISNLTRKLLGQFFQFLMKQLILSIKNSHRVYPRQTSICFIFSR